MFSLGSPSLMDHNLKVYVIVPEFLDRPASNFSGENFDCLAATTAATFSMGWPVKARDFVRIFTRF